METKPFTMTGKEGRICVLVAPVDIQFPTLNLNNFPSCCGAGQGFGDIIVPETLWGLRISAACFIHDWMWNNADCTWEYFHSSNAIFLRNMLEIIETQSIWMLKPFRRHRASMYFAAVDTVGASVFWKEKA
jgi:hypothetical protein